MNRQGFSLIEIVIVMSLFGAISAIALPRLRLSNQSRVRIAAQMMSRDLEAARSLAMSQKREVKILFDVDGGSFSVFVMDSLVRMVELDEGVIFSSGGDPLPGYPLGGAVTFDGDSVCFGPIGMPQPRGTRGVIYLGHEEGDGRAAVSIAGSGSFEAWSFTGGSWR